MADGLRSRDDCQGEGAGRLVFHFDVLLEGFDPESLLVRRGHDTEHAAETTPSYRSEVESAIGASPSCCQAAHAHLPSHAPSVPGTTGLCTWGRSELVTRSAMLLLLAVAWHHACHLFVIEYQLPVTAPSHLPLGGVCLGRP